MKTWHLWVGLALLALLLLTVREGFVATATIKNPNTWDAAELTRIKAMITPASTIPDADIRRVVGGFWQVWDGATERITLARVNAYLNSTQNLGTKRNEYRDLIQAYYIDQGQSVFQAASGYAASALTGSAGDMPTVMPGTPPATGGMPATPATPGGMPTVMPATPATPAPVGGTPAATGDMKMPGDLMASNDTSGATQGAQPGKNVWGPASGGRGSSATDNTTGGLGIPRNYPVLYGGMQEYASALPTSASLGTDPTSKFLPFSRVPGDQDLYPDPYRLGKYFSTSSYSSGKETAEPAPFLADFSKFLT